MLHAIGEMVLNGVQLGLGNVVQRCGDVVPAAQEAGEEVHGNQGLGQRQHDAQQNTEVGSAVDLGGFHHGLINVGEEGAEQEDGPGTHTG